MKRNKAVPQKKRLLGTVSDVHGHLSPEARSVLNSICYRAKDMSFNFKITSRRKLMSKKQFFLIIALIAIAPLAHASVESSLMGLKNVLIGSILPIFAVLGLGFAAFSFFTGNPNAKQHLVYAVTGATILFGAQSIVDLIQRTVR